LKKFQVTRTVIESIEVVAPSREALDFLLDHDHNLNFLQWAESSKRRLVIAQQDPTPPGRDAENSPPLGGNGSQ
jgi:hypothetical protein